MMNAEIRAVGIVGLGLMGSSIVTDLLIHGQKVIAVSPIKSDLDEGARSRVQSGLEACKTEGFTNVDPITLLANVTFTDDYDKLRDCAIVMECVVEREEIKQSVYEKIDTVIGEDAILTTNTSAIPISRLQKMVKRPERFFGMHYAEPAFTTKFLEITCGEMSNVAIGARLHAIATSWGKEPTLVRKDILGFITNRLMYALYREAFSLVEGGYATIEDVDRACKNDAGYWMTFCGPFRYMDLTGLQAYHAVIKNMFPSLSNRTDVPPLINSIAQAGGNGITNGKGFYAYSAEEAVAWEASFQSFAFDVHRLSEKYRRPVVAPRRENR